MTPAPTLQDLIASVRDDAASEDPLEQLAAAVGVAGDLDTVKDELLGYFVDRCRGRGKSWTEISAALGVTRQAAHRRFNVSSPPLDRFTARARNVIDHAPETARSLGHDYVGTEHLLLALFAEPESIAARILRERNVERPSVEAAIVLVAPRHAVPEGPIPYNPRAATALTGAVTSAIELGHNYVGTEHLLLALLRDPDALATRILAAHGVATDDVRTRVIEILASEVAAGAAATGASVDDPSLVASGVAVDGFARFSDAACAVIVRAEEAARSLQHAYVGTEHLLLGSFADDGNDAARVLDELGVTRDAVRDDIVRRVGVGPQSVATPLPFTPRARARIEQGLVEAGAPPAFAGPEHILLGLVTGDDLGLAAQILSERGVTRDGILELLETRRADDS
jgi:ATP-dependent Clp protease ATP-binding subunit ClpA